MRVVGSGGGGPVAWGAQRRAAQPNAQPAQPGQGSQAASRWLARSLARRRAPWSLQSSASVCRGRARAGEGLCVRVRDKPPRRPWPSLPHSHGCVAARSAGCAL